MSELLETIVILTSILVVVGLPVAGLVVRFALRPFVQDLANAIRSSNSGASHLVRDPEQWASLNRRLDRIERSLVDQEAVTSRLLEVQEFDRKLGSGLPEDPGSRREQAQGIRRGCGPAVDLQVVRMSTDTPAEAAPHGLKRACGIHHAACGGPNPTRDWRISAWPTRAAPRTRTWTGT